MSQRRDSPDGMQCPEPEQIASYVDNSMVVAERHRLEEHFADCDRCRELMAEVVRTSAEVALPSRAALSDRRRSWLGWTGGLGAAAALVVAVSLWSARGSNTLSDRPELAELVAAASESAVRPLEARLSGGFRYAPAPSTQRGPRADATVDVRLAALNILKRAESDNSVSNLSATGVAQLVVGDYGAAIDRLSSAVARDASLGHVWSDLAAAYLARDAAGDSVRALDAARRATTARRPPAEAWFNLALACERVGISDEARRAWNRVIEGEDGSPWAEEARQHLSNKREPPSGGGSAAAAGRDRLEGSLLPRWAEATQSGDSGAQREALANARSTAEALAQATGDRMFADIVTALAHARGTLAQDMAAGHLAYARGRALQEQDQVSAAAASYKEAVEKLSDRTAYGDWATLSWLSLARDEVHATEQLQSIADRASRDSYHNLSGRALWLIGLRVGLSGDFAASLPAYERAARAFAKTDERAWANSIRVLIAEAHELLGDYQAAWEYRLPALSYAETAHIRPSARWAMIGGAFRAALRQRLDGAAAVFQDVLVGLAQTEGTAVMLAQQLIARARLRTQQGDRPGAMADLDTVDQQLLTINDQRVRTTIGVDVQVERAQLASTPTERVNALTSALAAAAEAHLSYRFPALYRARASSHAELGAWSAATEDLAAARTAVAQQRAGLTDAQLRYTSFEETWPIFVESARIAVLAGDRSCDTFDVVEAGRVETTTASHGTRPAALRDVQQRLAPTAALVSFVRTRDRTFAWVVTRGRCDLFDLSIAEQELTTDVSALSAAITTGTGDWKPTATRLHDALFAPLRVALPGMTSIVIVPDGLFARVPFALLMDRATSQVLVEQYTLTLSPSATSWLDAVNLAAKGASSSARVLAVGNPERSDAQRSLPNLPYAAIEAREVALLFPGSVNLTGAAATRTNVLAAVPTSDILHFAGHAIAHDRVPWMSRLVMASETPDGPEFASLLGYELLQSRWSRLRLAFLSACSTAGGTQPTAAGWFGFATPLLAAGVPTVIVTLWNVNDQHTQPFATAFYRYVQTGMPPARALQRTQLQMMRTPGPSAAPASWAAFVLVGAGDQPLLATQKENE